MKKPDEGALRSVLPAENFGGPMIRVSMSGFGDIVAIRSARFSITTQEAVGSGRRFAAITLAAANNMALYFEHNAEQMRDMAASCLACADAIDNGRGKQ